VKDRYPPRIREPRTAGEAITAALGFRGITDDIRAQRIVAEWTDLVGPKIAQRTRPDQVRERVLIVYVATSAWMNELTLLKPQLLAGLHERLGEPRLFDDLRLQLASRDRRATEGPTAGRRSIPAPRPYSVPATGAARERIVKEAAAVDDAELRELIARVRIANDR
jgi:predicted nucleic acid-binding Zn ribbon protein